MYKIYFKQAVELLKQNPFISSISILGTAFAIMMIMTIIVSSEMKNVNVAPAVNRDRTMYMDQMTVRDTLTKSTVGGNINYRIYKNYLSKLKTPKYISTGMYGTYPLVNREGEKESFQSFNRYVDDAHWKIYNYTFKEGRAFTKEEFESGINCAVISETKAKELFKEESPVGKFINMDFKTFGICGVVADVSPLIEEANGSVWAPYTTLEITDNSAVTTILFMAESRKDFPLIEKEIREMEKKYNIENAPKMLYVNGPDSKEVKNLSIWADDPETKVT